jgi:Ras-related protein Rab-11A
MSKEKYDYIMKLILIGDASVGKTNILTKYLKNEFDPNSKATVGVELGTKNIQIDNKIIKVQIWDTAGQERYKAITSTYYKGAKGAIIVYDITRKITFDNIEKWIGDLKVNGDENIIIFLVGNKSDLNDNREVSKEDGLNKSEKFNIPFLETSALCGENISKVFEELIQKVYINNKEELVEHNKKEIKKGVDLNEIKNENNTAEKSEKKGCCS